MQVQYHPLLVFISIAIAAFGSWVALAVVRSAHAASGSAEQRCIVLAALAFATATWSMHFTGMLAMQSPVELAYNPGLVAVSILPAFVAALPAFWIIGTRKIDVSSHILTAGLLVAAVCSMHYTAMHSLRMSPPVHNPALTLLSVLIAAITAYVGLGFAVFWRHSDKRSFYRRGASALLLGSAVGAMHYLAVAAAHFPPASASSVVTHAIDGVSLARLAISSTLLILILLLFISLRSDHFAGWRLLSLIAVASITATSLSQVLVTQHLSEFIHAVSIAALLVLLVFPAAWRLNAAGIALLDGKREVEESLQGQQAINRLLALPTHELDLHELLQKALAIVMDIPWLLTLPQGAIYLADAEGRKLRRAVQLNLAPEGMQSCAQIDYGYCCCGQAALQEKAQYYKPEDAAHEFRHADMPDHGHYCVPLLAGGKVHGVLCLYVQAGHNRKPSDLSIIEALGAAIGSLIVRKRAELDLQLADTVFRHNLSCLMVTDAETRILNVNPMFLKVTGYRKSELIGKTPAILKSGRQDAAFYTAMWKQLSSDGQWAGEIWNRRKNGEVYPEWLSITGVRDSKGNTSHFVATFIDISVQKEAEARIEQLAYYDALTGLANRTLFHSHLQKVLVQAQRDRDTVVLLFIDLDHFKSVNDTLGHDVGDEMLKDVAMRLVNSVREGDILSRLGGDEFVAILRERPAAANDPVEAARKVVERIIHCLEEPFEYGKQRFHCGASIGIAVFPNDGNTSSELMQRADTAMYEAKKAGRSTYRFFSQAMSERIERRMHIEQALRKALEAEKVALFYQPQIDTQSRQMIGAEALLRWQDDELGEIAPAEFVSIAEDCGIIRQLGEWVFTQVCLQRAAWDRKGYTTLPHIALNVSVHQLMNQNFVQRLTDIMAQTGVTPQGIELEITEGGLARYQEETSEVIRALRKLGFKLAIDDFGTDYSSLSRLKSFDVQLLKIDQSFVRDMAVDSDDAAIVRAIIQMGQALGMTVMAEGVETYEQAALLHQYGCSRCQGYYFGKPMHAEAFEKLLANGIDFPPLSYNESAIMLGKPDSAKYAGRV
ncbi:MAG: EAL domain-containing protein [Gammaproteobacteria bacterium]